MANIANFEVNGVSYSYDTESRNPLSDKVKVKAFEGGLVYDINTKAPTEVDSSKAEEVVILPPFGQMYLYFGLGIAVLAVVVGGVILIKKIILKK